MRWALTCGVSMPIAEALSVASWLAVRPVCEYVVERFICWVSRPRLKPAAEVWHCRHCARLG